MNPLKIQSQYAGAAHGPQQYPPFFSSFDSIQFAVVAALVALCFRILFLWVNPDLTFAGICVKGVPFSDALMWNELARDVAAGKGMAASAQRPGYLFFLACIYNWFGDTLALAKWANILCDAMGIGIVCYIGGRYLHPAIGVFSACFLTISTLHLGYSLTVMTETLGFFLTTISLLLTIEGLQKDRKGYLAGGSCFLALSNLTRPLSLLSVPILTLYIFFFFWKRGQTTRSSLYKAAIFLGVFLITFCPWLLRQKVTHDIWSITDGTQQSLYFATSPEYGRWSAALANHPELVNADIKTRYDFFSRGIINNLQKYPAAYLVNIGRTFFDFLNALYFHQFAFVACAFLFLIGWTFAAARNGKKELSVKTLMWSVFLVEVIWLLPQRLSILFIGYGIYRTVKHGQSPVGAVLTIYLLFCGAGQALVGGHLMPRTHVMLDWNYIIFFYAALSGMMIALSKPLMLQGDFYPLLNRSEIGNSGRRLVRGIRGLALICVFFFSLSGAHIVYRTFLGEPVPASPGPFQNRADVLSSLQGIPGLSTPDLNIENMVILPHDADTKIPLFTNGQMVAGTGTIGPYLHILKAGEAPDHWSRLFHARPYERTVFHLPRVGYFIFPGILDGKWRYSPILAVGRVDIDYRYQYEGRIILEGVAIISLTTDEPPKVLFADHPLHRKYLK